MDTLYQIDINAARDQVVGLLSDLDMHIQINQWIREYHILNGKPLEQGFSVKFDLIFGHRFSYTQTVTQNNLPDSIEILCEAPGLSFLALHNFEENSDGTSWKMEMNVSQSRYIKIIEYFFPVYISKEIKKQMALFKQAAEKT